MLEGGKADESRESMLNSHLIKLFLAGTILTFAGFLLSYGCPINKKIWSPTFVLATCGLASSFLALLIWIIDVKGYKKWSLFFESFGVNPLFMYVLGGVLGILFGSICFPWGEGSISIHGFLYKVLLMPVFGEPAVRWRMRCCSSASTGASATNSINGRFISNYNRINSKQVII